VLAGVVAIALDGGRLLEERRRTQTAADAAALAAAADLYANYPANQGADPAGTAQAAALRLAAANGYANDGTASVVTVNIPPQSGAFAGRSDFVEVVVQSNLHRTFSAVFTGGDLPVRARSVARGRPSRIGVLLLDPSSANSLSVLGNGSLTVVNASIVVDSASPSAVSVSNNATVKANSCDITGGIMGGVLGLLTALLGGGNVATGVPPTPDPLKDLPAPDPTAYPVRYNQPYYSSGPGPQVLQPGVYQGGIQISGKANVTLQPGVYILQGGGLVVAGQSSLTGNGVMIYNTGPGGVADPIQIGSTGPVNLTPPTSGTYTGISIFQDRRSTAAIQLTGGATFNLSGMVYAAGATALLSGNAAGNIIGGGYVCKGMEVSGNGSIRIDPGGTRPRVPDVGLSE
jgi:hypothetical protein